MQQQHAREERLHELVVIRSEAAEDFLSGAVGVKVGIDHDARGRGPQELLASRLLGTADATHLRWRQASS